MGCGSSVAMDKSFCSTSALDDNIVWSGRIHKDTKKGVVEFDWSGTKMSFGVAGSPRQVWIKLDGQDNCFNVYIDGEYQSSFYAPSREVEHCLIKDLNRNATIWVVKRTEASNGLVSSTPAKVRSVGLPYDCQIVKPTVGNSRKIEFIGDSDSAAFGNLAPKSGLALGAMVKIDSKKQDVELGWTGFVSRAFQADQEGIVVSGTGAAWDGDGDADCRIGIYYPRKLYSKSDTHATALDPVDLVVIYLGGNDFEGKLKNDPSKGPEFVAAYASLLKTIRRYRPDTPILCFACSEACGSALETKAAQKAMSQCCHDLVPQAITAAGSQNIMFASNPASIDLDDDSLWGSLLHWSVKGHVLFARAAIDIIAKHMSWEPCQGWDNYKAEVFKTAGKE